MSKVYMNIKYDNQNSLDSNTSTTGSLGMNRIDYIGNQELTINDLDMMADEKVENSLKTDKDEVEQGFAPSEIYSQYIHERKGSTGLFNEYTSDYDIEQAKEAIKSFNGTIYRMIYSIREEEAYSIGLKRKKDWQKMLKKEMPKIIKNIGMNPNKIKWYGAYHNKEGHPHVHVLFYDPNQYFEKQYGYIQPENLEKARIQTIKNIFPKKYNDLVNEKNENRDKALDQSIKTIRDHRKKLLKLGKKIQKRVGKGRYNYKLMPKDIKSDIDILTEKIINENPELKRAKESYLESVNELQSLYRNIETEVSKYDNKDNVNNNEVDSKKIKKILKNAEQDFNKRVANTMLKEVKIAQRVSIHEKIKIKEKGLNNSLDEIKSNTKETILLNKDIINETTNIELENLNLKQKILYQKYIGKTNKEIKNAFKNNIKEYKDSINREIEELKKLDIDLKNSKRINKKTIEHILLNKKLNKSDYKIINKLDKDQDDGLYQSEIYHSIKDNIQKDYSNLLSSDYYVIGINKINENNNFVKHNINELSNYQNKRIKLLENKGLIKTNINNNILEIRLTELGENEFENPKYKITKSQMSIIKKYFRMSSKTEKEREQFLKTNILNKPKNKKNEITINKKLVKEKKLSDKEIYHTKIPFKNEYINYKKTNSNWIHDDKTLHVKIDPNKEYKIYNKNEQYVKSIMGSEIYDYYDNIGKNNSKKSKYQLIKERIEQIEKYCKNKNIEPLELIKTDEENTFMKRLRYLEKIKILKLNENNKYEISHKQLEKLSNKKTDEKIEIHDLSNEQKDILKFYDKNNGKMDKKKYIRSKENYINYILENEDQSNYQIYKTLKKDNKITQTIKTLAKISLVKNDIVSDDIRNIIEIYRQKVNEKTPIKITKDELNQEIKKYEKYFNKQKEKGMKIITSKDEYKTLKKQLTNIKTNHKDIYDYSKLFRKKRIINGIIDTTLTATKSRKKDIKSIVAKYRNLKNQQEQEKDLRLGGELLDL